MDGFETALWLREYNPAIKVLVMTMHDDERTSLKMYKAGVRGVILKNHRWIRTANCY
jgi:DNA-binding NarL/FixJ family response regulator